MMNSRTILPQSELEARIATLDIGPPKLHFDVCNVYNYLEAVRTHTTAPVLISQSSLHDKLSNVKKKANNL